MSGMMSEQLLERVIGHVHAEAQQQEQMPHRQQYFLSMRLCLFQLIRDLPAWFNGEYERLRRIFTMMEMEERRRQNTGVRIVEFVLLVCDTIPVALVHWPAKVGLLLGQLIKTAMEARMSHASQLLTEEVAAICDQLTRLIAGAPQGDLDNLHTGVDLTIGFYLNVEDRIRRDVKCLIVGWLFRQSRYEWYSQEGRSEAAMVFCGKTGLKTRCKPQTELHRVVDETLTHNARLFWKTAICNKKTNITVLWVTSTTTEEA